MAAEKITFAEFEEKVLNSQNPVLLDFWREECGPCEALAPVVEEVANTRTDIKVYKINSNEEKELVDKYLVMSVPTLIVIKDGAVKKKTIGFKSIESLNALIDTAIAD